MVIRWTGYALVGLLSFAHFEGVAQTFLRPSQSQLLASISVQRTAIFHQRNLSRAKRYEKALLILHKDPSRPLIPLCLYQENQKGDSCLEIGIADGDDYSSRMNGGWVSTDLDLEKDVSIPIRLDQKEIPTADTTLQLAPSLPITTTGESSLGSGSSNSSLPSDTRAKPASEIREGAQSKEDSRTGGKSSKPPRYALVFANSSYKGEIPRLETPAADAERVARLLKNRYGYLVTKVIDASKAATIASLNKLLTEAIEAESVIIYYAGHGYSDAKTEVGYWIPVDASADSPDRWISNADVNLVIRAIKARSVLLVSDSCFSGRFVAEALLEEYRPTGFPVNGRAITVLSSGDDEPVSDDGFEGNSVFAWSFSRHLEKVQDTLLGRSLWDLVRKEVTKAYPQTPRYGALLSAGHTLGLDFLFRYQPE